MEYETITHTFEPVYDGNSKILILGSLPSVKSRENNFYYGNPQNRFWKVLAKVFSETNVPVTIEEKTEFLLDHHLAVWDVIKQCDIKGSSDSSIKNVIANDMKVITDKAPIELIIANGGKAYELYMKYCYKNLSYPVTKLPSTSPANAAYNVDRLSKEWAEKLKDLL